MKFAYQCTLTHDLKWFHKIWLGVYNDIICNFSDFPWLVCWRTLHEWGNLLSDSQHLSLQLSCWMDRTNLWRTHHLVWSGCFQERSVLIDSPDLDHKGRKSSLCVCFPIILLILKVHFLSLFSNDSLNIPGVAVSKLCQHGGTCHNVGNTHNCTCPHGYQGSYCETEVDECQSAPCLNGATCLDGVGKYSCLCKAGFEGDNCEKNVDECAHNPCTNGGICHDQDNNFTCSCLPGTKGLLCELDEKDCFVGACFHGGTCIEKINGYGCDCRPGYVGPRCEGDINECLSNPCDAVGTHSCIQMVNDYRCECNAGYRGKKIIR